MADGPWQNFNQQQPTTTPTQAPWTGFGDQQGQPAAAAFRRPSATPPTAVAGTVEEWMAANPPPLDAVKWGEQTGARGLSPQELDAAFRQSNPDAAAAYDAWTEQFTSFLNERQIPALSGDPMSQGEMAVRTLGQGATLGLADDIARGLGQAFPSVFPNADNWAMQQERGPEMYRETNPINAGALDLAGNMLPAAILGLPSMLARTAGGRTAVATVGGALEGGAAGYGYQDSTVPTAQRLAQSIPLAAIGAAGGRLGADAATRSAVPTPPEPIDLPPLGTPPPRALPATTAATPAPVTQTFRRGYSEESLREAETAWREQATQLYAVADQSGGAIPRAQADDVLEGLLGSFQGRVDPGEAPARFLNNLIARVADYPDGIPLQRIEAWRQELGEKFRAASRQGSEDAVLFAEMRQAFDEQIAELITYAPAREAYLNGMRISTIGEAATRAANRASQSARSFEQELQAQLRRIAENQNLMNVFNDEQRAAITRAVRAGGLGGVGLVKDVFDSLLSPLQRQVGGIAAVGAAFAGAPVALALPAADLGIGALQQAQRRSALRDMMDALGNPYPIPLAVPSLRQTVGAGAGMLAAPPQLPE